jgi:hypothetical protein
MKQHRGIWLEMQEGDHQRGLSINVINPNPEIPPWRGSQSNIADGPDKLAR